MGHAGRGEEEGKAEEEEEEAEGRGRGGGGRPAGGSRGSDHILVRCGAVRCAPRWEKVQRGFQDPRIAGSPASRARRRPGGKKFRSDATRLARGPIYYSGYSLE